MSDIAVERVRDADLAEILRNYELFWADRDLPWHLHHPMFFLEFGDTAFVVRDLGAREIAGYLLGFVAPTGDGYIHVVAVRDDYRRLGLGRALYQIFDKTARDRGVVALKAITSPENVGSVEFHKRVGFSEVIKVKDYGGSGRTRIVMRKPFS